MTALVIFDLDGTLVDTADEIAEATRRTLAEFGISGGSTHEVRRWIGHGVRRLMETAWTTYGGDTDTPLFEEVMARFYAHYAATAGTTSTLYPRVRETLASLSQRGMKLALLTNKDAAYTRPIIEKHGLADFFDVVLCGDQLAAKKPDPCGALECMRSTASAPDQTLYVGDSQTDVATARAAGIRCWAVPYGYNHGQPISSAAPDREIEDVSAVLSLQPFSADASSIARC